MFSSMISKASSSQAETMESLQLERFQLEALAEELQEHLFSQGLVKDRHYRSRTVPMAFLGKDAVTLIMDLLDGPVTRVQALLIGRQIEQEYKFFSHSKSTTKTYYVLEDTSSDSYQFRNNLPVQVYKTKKRYPCYWDKAKALEEYVQLRSHRGLVQVHDDCFTARELVDAIMKLKMVQSRKQGVQLVLKMNDKMSFCRSVVSVDGGSFGYQFNDDGQLWRFVPVDQRPVPVAPSKSFSSKPQRRMAMKDSSNSSSKTRTSSRSAPTKDVAYFQDRASQIRSRLDVYRCSRTAPPKDIVYFQDRASQIRDDLDVYRSERSSPITITATSA